MHRALIPVFAGGVLLLSAVVPSGSLRAGAQDATPASECQSTTPDQNKEIVRNWFAALSGGTGEEIAALASPDIVYHDPSPEEEAQTGGADTWAGERQQDYPDLQVTPEQIIAENDMVASYNRYVGTQEGDVEDELGIPATGLQTEWVSMGLFRIECGKIAEIWSVADDLGRLQGLGVITAEELQSAAPVATPES